MSFRRGNVRPVSVNADIDKSELLILCYGFGMSPYFLDRLERFCSANCFEARWEIVLPSGHHERFIKAETNFSEIHNVAQLVGVQSDLSQDHLTGPLSGPLVEDLDVEKRPISSRNRRERAAHAQHVVMTKILMRRNPGVLLFPQAAENPEGRMLARLANELGWKVLIPVHTRYFDTTYFCGTVGETAIPDSGRRLLSDEEETFLRLFRERQLGPNPVYAHPGNSLSAARLPVSRRDSLRRFFTRLRYDKGMLSPQSLRVSLFTTWIPVLWNAIQVVRASRARKLFDFELGKLPTGKFIYFPLQYTPESSINMHAPFFVDQLRVIDLIRQSLPDGYFLVVKEHPTAIGVRKLRFMRTVLKRVGVRVVKFDSDSFELVQRASLTLSVTGTAALEAKLLGKKSATLATTFFSTFVPVVDLMTGGRQKLVELLEDDTSDICADGLVASVFDHSFNFIAGAPEASGRVLTEENIAGFGEALERTISSRAQY